MKHTLENDILTLFFEGELNSFNSEEVEKEIEVILKNNKFSSIVLDMDKLTYISSAGIRIIIRLRKQYDVSLINVTKDVFNIFDMVGLQSILKIERKN